MVGSSTVASKKEKEKDEKKKKNSPRTRDVFAMRLNPARCPPNPAHSPRHSCCGGGDV